MKLFSGIIIIFVFLVVLAGAAYIVYVSVTSPYSNAHTVARYLESRDASHEAARSVELTQGLR